MVLREGGGAVHGAKAGHRVTLTGELGTALAESVTFASAAEAEALLARVRGEVTADSQIRVTFPPEQRAMNQSQTDLAVAIRYDLEETSKTRRSGLEPIRRTRDNLYSAHFNDASGEAVLFIRGFSGRHPRDEQARALVQAMAETRRYRRQDGEGRVHFVVTARNGRELARSRWFATWAECEAMIAWLVSVAPASLAAQGPPPAPAKSAAGYLLTRPSNGAVGFETFRGDDRRHYFHLNDGGGAALLFSHGYSSPRERDAGMRALIRVATVRDAYQVRRDGAHFHFAVLAGNSRELARSRDFASAETTQAAIRWTVGAIARLGADAGVRRPPTMLLEVSSPASATAEASGELAASAVEVASGELVERAAEVSGELVERAAEVSGELVERAAEVSGELAASAAEVASGELVERAVEVSGELAERAAEVASEAPDAMSVTASPAPLHAVAGPAARSAKIPRRVEAFLAALRSNPAAEHVDATTSALIERVHAAETGPGEEAETPVDATRPLMDGAVDSLAPVPAVEAPSVDVATPAAAAPAADESTQSDARPSAPTSSQSRRSDPQEFPASVATMLMTHDDSRPYRVQPRVPPPEEATTDPTPVAPETQATARGEPPQAPEVQPATSTAAPVVEHALEPVIASREPVVVEHALEPVVASREPVAATPVELPPEPATASGEAQRSTDAPAPASVLADPQPAASAAPSPPVTSQPDAPAPAMASAPAKSQPASIAASKPPAKPLPAPSLAASKLPGPIPARPRLSPPPAVSSGAPAKPVGVASDPKPRVEPADSASALPRLPANLLAVASQPPKLKPPRIASAPTPGEPPVPLPPLVPFAAVKPADSAPGPAPSPAVIMHVAPEPAPPTLSPSAPSLVPSLVPEFATKPRESQGSAPSVIMRGAVDPEPLVAPSLVPSVLPDPVVRPRAGTTSFAVIHDGVPKQRSSGAPSSTQTAAKKRRTIDSIPPADMYARLVDDLAADPYPPGSPEGEEEPPPPRSVAPTPIPSLIPEVMHTPAPPPVPAAPAAAPAAIPPVPARAMPVPRRDRGGGGLVLFFIGLVPLDASPPSPGVRIPSSRPCFSRTINAAPSTPCKPGCRRSPPRGRSGTSCAKSMLRWRRGTISPPRLGPRPAARGPTPRARPAPVRRCPSSASRFQRAAARRSSPPRSWTSSTRTTAAARPDSYSGSCRPRRFTSRPSGR
jgi:uncharacterized protein YegP (UPF0339 family)